MALAVAATTTTTTSQRDGSALQLPTQYFFWFYPLPPPPAVAGFPSSPPRVLFTWSPCVPHAFIPSRPSASTPLCTAEADSHSARLCNRQVPSARNGQWAEGNETCKSLPMGGDGRVGTDPELVFFSPA
jgi:hypothetical protein